MLRPRIRLARSFSTAWAAALCLGAGLASPSLSLGQVIPPDLRYRSVVNGSSSWENPACWTNAAGQPANRVPGPNDAVFISGINGVINLTGPKAVKSLEIGNVSTLDRPILTPPASARGINITTTGPIIIGRGVTLSGRDGTNTGGGLDGGAVILTSLGTTPPGAAAAGITNNGTILGGAGFGGNPLLNRQGGNGARVEIVASNGNITNNGTIRGGAAGVSLNAAPNTAGEADLATHTGDIVNAGTITGGAGARGTNPNVGADAVVLPFSGNLNNGGAISGGQGGAFVGTGPGADGGNVVISVGTTGNVARLGRLAGGAGGNGGGGRPAGTAGSVSVDIPDHAGSIAAGAAPAGTAPYITGKGVRLTTKTQGSIDLSGLSRNHVSAGDDGAVIDTNCVNGVINLRRAGAPVRVITSTCCVTLNGYCLINGAATVPALAGPVIIGNPRSGLCVRDFDLNGLFDVDDFIAYLRAWILSAPEADLNCDGAIDALDFHKMKNPDPLCP